MARVVWKDPNESATQLLSVSLSIDQYAELSAIARKYKVSIAWVVREPLERLLKDELPLLRGMSQ